MDFDLSAAIWRKGITEEKAFITALGERLSQALPGKVKVEKKKKFFSKDEHVSLIEVTFEEMQFILKFQPQHGVTTEKSKVVRDIRLRTDRISFDDWLSELSKEIEIYAQKHIEIRSSLERFLLN